MRFRKELIALAAALLLSAAPALGQPAGSPPGTEPSNPDAVLNQKLDKDVQLVLRDAADALGMVRFDRSRTPPRNQYDVVHTYEFVGAGMYAGQKAAKATIGIDFGIYAIRADVETAAGEHDIKVASGQLAWDESKPGVFAKAGTTNAAERLRLTWILPPAVIHAAVKAPEKVKVATQDGRKELIVALPDGSEVKGVLNPRNVMTRIEMRTGGKTYVGEYDDFRSDVQDMEVMFPYKIVQTVDGQVVTDLALSEHYANPYVIFPVPKELGR